MKSFHLNNMQDLFLVMSSKLLLIFYFCLKKHIKGLIDEETRDLFNIPAYMRSKEEVESAINKCGGFEIKRMEYKRMVEHSEEKHQEWIMDPVSYGRAKANLVRATLRPIVDAHIGPYLSDQFFNRFQTRVSSDSNLLYKTCFYGVIIVSAIRI